MPLLAAPDYPSVRGLLDVTFIESVWPADAVFDLPIFAPEAERLITAWAPDAVSSADPATQEAVKTAAMYLTASLVAPSVPQLKSESEGGYAYTAAVVDWGARAAELKALALNTLAVFKTTDTVPVVRHTSFRIATPWPRW